VRSVSTVLDDLVADLLAASAEGTPQLAVRDVLERAMRDPRRLADELPCERAGLVPIHTSPQLSIFKVVWAPGMAVPPHDHRMWAAIGVYGGREDNAFWRRADAGASSLEQRDGKALVAGDVALMGDDTIHSVTAPAWTGAIHVYGGDFVNQPRSMWVDGVEEASDTARSAAIFEAANRAATAPDH
jgi:predicted metal-dependent enzyme (double-stranded beta helix superfamily)